MSALLIACLFNVAIPQVSESKDICFPPKYYKQLEIDLSICDQAKKDLILIKRTNELLTEGSSICKEELDLTIKDKEEYKSQSLQFKETMLAKNKELDEERAKKPSRLTWFGVGFGSAVLTGILMAFIVK